jgi:hypothetical protein
MRTRHSVLCAVVLLAAQSAMAAERTESLDLRRAVPADVYLAVHARHNPERDFQREYYREVWKTVQETQILQRVVKIVTAQMSEEDLQKAKSVVEEFRKAAAPIDFQALLDASEIVYAQSMQIPAAQHLLLVRLGDKAAGWEEGIKNLFGLAEKYSEGHLTVETSKEGDTTITTLSVPQGVPLRPAVARVDDVLLLCSSDDLARRSLSMLLSGKGDCKFDDPRLKEALSRLPEPEDSLVFYDGKLQFSQLRQLGSFIRHQAEAGDPNAEKAAGLVELLFDELSVLDYEVTVEYTEGNHNRSETYGKLLPGGENKLLTRMAFSGQPFQNWQTWVPAEALSFRLTMGINLHPLYERAISLVKERFPEAQPLLGQFEKLQADHDLYLDRDILQAFSGEAVSVSLPAATPSTLGGQDSVIALRCHKPDRIRELLHRLVDTLKQHPIAKAQQLELIKCEKLEGFEELSAVLLTAFGAKPVIGFRDGWMLLGSNAQAVEKVLAARAGQAKTMADSEAFQRLNLKVEGPVASISYTNLAESTRSIAKLLNQVGAVAPLIVGLAGAEAPAEELKPVQEVLGLLPDVAKIVAKFDFLEAQLSVTQAGGQPGTYLRRTVTVVRPKSGG